MASKLKKHLNRFEQWGSQTVGRAEKTDVLSEVQEVDRRVERMIFGVQQTKNRLTDCLRTKSKEENADKRKKKAVEEYNLVQQLITNSRDMEGVGESHGLLSEIFGLYGYGQDVILDELVQMEMDIDKKVLDRFGRYTEEEKNVKDLKERLKKAVLDMDSAKRRLASSQGAEKMDQLQDECDKAVYKVDGLKDNYVLDLYTLASKEIEIASLFSVLLEIQLEYHRTAARTLDKLLPEIQRKIATYPRRPVYGCPLEDHLRYSGREIAVVLEVCCSALNEIGLRDEGLFRISGNQVKVKKLKAGFDAGEIDLTDYDKDPHSIAGALKLYLREMPEPLMTHSMYNEWAKTGVLEGNARLDAVKEILSMLPPANYSNLRYLFKFLQRLSKQYEHTKMSVSNLAIVIGPNLIWNPVDGDNMLGSRLAECILSNAEYFFPGDITFSSPLISSLFNDTGGFGSTQNGVAALKGSEWPSDNTKHSKRPKAPAPPPPRFVPPPVPPTYRSTIIEEPILLDATESAPLAKCSSAESDIMGEYEDEHGYATVAVEQPSALELGYSVVRKQDRPQSASPEKNSPSGSGDASPQSNTTPRSHRKTQSGPIDFVPVRKAPTQPNRPPLPTKEVIERNSVTRGSFGRSGHSRPVSYMVSMKEENLIKEDETKFPQRPMAAPRKHINLVRDEIPEESNQVTITIATPADQNSSPDSPDMAGHRAWPSSSVSRSTSSLDSPKEKPPVPMKPKNMETDWAVTKL